MSIVTVLAGPERPRRWTSAEKRRIIEESRHIVGTEGSQEAFALPRVHRQGQGAASPPCSKSCQSSARVPRDLSSRPGEEVAEVVASGGEAVFLASPLSCVLADAAERAVPPRGSRLASLPERSVFRGTSRIALPLVR